MKKIPVIAIIDVGKTNKKLFLFDEHYKLLHEKSAKFFETIDEDGFPCEDLEALAAAALDSVKEVVKNKNFDIQAVNFTTYGASFVYIDEYSKPLTPLYNYLKPYPVGLQKKFYSSYGGEEQFTLETASPMLGSLNSGMQLYRIKYELPEIFKKLKYALHLPQYLSFLFSGKLYSDITSIGCHTNLWNFQTNKYHQWLLKENLVDKLAPIVSSNHIDTVNIENKFIKIGIGLHDSSSSLIPYLINFKEPFVLISTGTWCISLNPFNQTPLTTDELAQDCLCYLHYLGKPVKASRIFAGNEHEIQVKRIAEHFNKTKEFYKSIEFDPHIINTISCRKDFREFFYSDDFLLKESGFAKRDLNNYDSIEEAYYQLIADIIRQQITSTNLVLKTTNVKRIFVDGGFGKNPVYMHLLAGAYLGIEIYAASMVQATALGAAIAIHNQWNTKPLPTDLIELKYYNAYENKTAQIVSQT